jgi:polyisoprenoid-binding protein YceI
MATTNWVSDSAHSEISFKIKHLMITSVKGRFDQFDAKVITDEEDFSKAEITFTAETASINTGVADRDGHLRSGDFFDADSYPQIRFVSTDMRKKSNDEFELTGDLTIRDVTKPVSLDVEFGGVVKDPYGQTKAGFTLEGKINRKDFGLTWGALTEAGGVVVADEVKILCEVQLIKQA